MYYNPLMQYGKLAALYDGFMSDVDRGGWADYLMRFIPKGADVLECACGTGEMSIRLASRGLNVTAADISDEMLMVAARKQREAGVPASRLRFVNMDMRTASCHKKVDCVVSCCDGVNYLTSRADAMSFFTAANSALKPGGLLLFDVSSRYKLSRVLGNNCFTDNGEERAYLWQNTYDEKTKLIRMELSFFVKKGALYERSDETHIQRAHSVRELTSWLRETGFEPAAYSFMTGKAPKEEDERIQFAARKI